MQVTMLQRVEISATKEVYLAGFSYEVDSALGSAWVSQSRAVLFSAPARKPLGDVFVNAAGKLVDGDGDEILDANAIRAAVSRDGKEVWVTDAPYNAQPTTDGSVVAWDAMQAAIDAVWLAGGGTVVIPDPGPGKYWKIRKALQARSGVKILVPYDHTRIVCTGDFPGVEWPTYGALMTGGYTTPNYWRTTAYPIANTTIGDPSVTCSTPAHSANFAIGDVVAVETDARYTIGSYDRPAWLQMNVVTDVVGDTLHLRHPIDTTQTTVSIRQLVTTLKVQEASGSLSDYTLAAIRDFELIGGTWEASNGDAPFDGGGGAINCIIRPYKTKCATGTGYGNLFAYCVMGERYFEGRRYHTELAFGSHHNVVDCEVATFLGSGASTWAYAFNEGARSNRVTVGHAAGGSVVFDNFVKVTNSSRNILKIYSCSGESTTAAIAYIEFLTYAGTRPNAQYNDVDLGACEIAASTRHAQCGFNTSDNRIGGTFTGTVSSGQSVTPGSGNRNTYDVVSQFGVLAEASGVGNLFRGRLGYSGGQGQYVGAFSNDFQLRTASYYALRAIGFLQPATSASSAATYTKTVTVPAGTMLVGDRCSLKLRGRGTGSVGTKTITVTFGGTTLFTKTVAAGQVGVDLDMLLQAVSNTAIVGSWRYQANAACDTSEGQNASINLTTTAYDLVVSITVASAGDGFTLRSLGLDPVRPQDDGRIAA